MSTTEKETHADADAHTRAPRDTNAQEPQAPLTRSLRLLFDDLFRSGESSGGIQLDR
jgi:hypothetical protein